MILDAHDLPDGQALSADLCIVGGGAAGIAMGLALIGSGLDILLLEAGGWTEEPETQALYAGSVSDARLHSPPDTYRQRRFGGSTTVWGGRCMPFDPIDFEARPDRPDRDWPIGFEALAPYYPQANRLCEAGRFAYTAETAFDTPLPPMIAGFKGTHFTANTLERFSCPTDFGRRYRRRLTAATRLRVVLHANVVSIDLDPAGTAVESVSARSLRGTGLRISATHVVLATGGLETARLLLANRDRHAQGIGNAHDVVGRYYMCHLAGTIGSISFVDPDRAVRHGYDLSDEGVYCRRRLALRPETQRRLGLGNFVARLHHPRIADPRHGNAILSMLYLARPFIPYEYRKRLADEGPFDPGQWLRHVGNLARGLPDAVAFMIHLLRDRRLAERKFPSIVITPRTCLYSLDFHAEQEPNPDSRVFLTRDTDALGMPRLEIDWRYTAADVATVSRALALLAEDIGRLEGGRFAYDPDRVEQEMTRYGAYGGHHIGTARMGADPRRSVVDADCRVHGLANLHIASAAVFPTSSQANPTLTIVALALRLAAHLRDRIAAGRVSSVFTAQPKDAAP